MTSGERNRLTCVATVEEYLQTTPTLVWRLPENSEATSLGEQQTSGTVSNRTLTLNPLRTSHGGVYVCEATVSLPGIAPENQTANETVYVQSEWLGQ